MDDRSYHLRVPKRWVRIAMIVGVTALVVAPLTAIATDAFTDVPGSNTHHADIAWLKDAEVTKGCNPPDNDRYCPSDFVTRAQMATFMRNLATNKVVDAGSLDGKPPGAYAENLWAVINTNGNLARGANVVSAGTLGSGHYEVIFDRDVSECSYTATVGSPGISGTASVEPRSDQSNGVFVTTFNATGNEDSRGFHLMVMCGATTVSQASAGELSDQPGS